MSSAGFPAGIYSKQVEAFAGVNTVAQAIQQAPIAAQLDILEKSLMQLREGGLMLHSRLSSVMKIRPQAPDAGKVSGSGGDDSSAITSRLMHLWSIVNEIQQTVNTIHSDLEL